MISPDFTNADRAHLVRFVRGFVRSRDLAEDIAQDALLRAQKFDSSNVENFTAWLYKIARNLCVDHYQANREALTVEYPESIIDCRPDPHQFAMHEQVRRAVSDLEPRFREVVQMYYFEGLSYNDMVERTGINLQTLLSRMNRAKAKLRKRLTN